MQGAVSIAGVRWLHGMEQHLAELGDAADAVAAGQGTNGSSKPLRQDVRTKAGARSATCFFSLDVMGFSGRDHPCHGLPWHLTPTGKSWRAHLYCPVYKALGHALGKQLQL